MGLVFEEVVFDGRAPQLSHIADKITELSGLPLGVIESGPDVKGDLYDLHGYLAFACAPKQQLEIHAYRDGTVRKHRLPMGKCVQGMHEPSGTQSVYLRSFIGQEPTLLLAATLALEAMGGHPKHLPGDEVRREYGTPVTPAQLAERQRKLAGKLWPAVGIALLLLPVAMLLWFIEFLVQMPWLVWKVHQWYRTGRGEGPGR
jgi:hypothetical protein